MTNFFKVKFLYKVVYRVLLRSKYFVLTTYLHRIQFNILYENIEKKIFNVNASLLNDISEKLQNNTYATKVLKKESNLYRNGQFYFFNRTVKKENFNQMPITKNIIKNQHWSTYNIATLNTHEDIKYIWEINRLHFIDVEIFMFLLKNDELHFSLMYKDIIKWMEENPFDYSINWFSNMEIAIRLMKFIFLFSLVKDDHQKESLLHCIVQHYTHLKSDMKFTQYTMGGNHYLIELIATATFEVIFDIKSAKESQKKLNLEIDKQFLDDGSHMEGSSGYLIYLFNAILFYKFLIKLYNKCENLDQNKIKNIYSFINIISSNNEVVNFGDWDDGKVCTFNHMVPTNINDTQFFYELLYDDNDKNDIVRSYYTNQKLAIFDTKNVKLMFKYSDVKHGHSHLDMLSIYLWEDNEQLIFDGGTKEYNNNQRDFYRSLKSHSTIVVDNKYLPIETYRTFSWNGELNTIYHIENENCISAKYQLTNSKIVSRNITCKKESYSIEDVIPSNMDIYIHYIIKLEKYIIDKDSHIFYLSNNVKIVIKSIEIKFFNYATIQISKIYGETIDYVSLKIYPNNEHIVYEIIYG